MDVADEQLLVRYDEKLDGPILTRKGELLRSYLAFVKATWGAELYAPASTEEPGPLVVTPLVP